VRNGVDLTFCREWMLCSVQGGSTPGGGALVGAQHSLPVPCVQSLMVSQIVLRPTLISEFY
jgi:hypothetical protein